MNRIATFAIILATAPLLAQGPPNPQSLIAAEKTAMTPLAWMDGVWRGSAWTLTPSGKHEVTQTERIGPFLDGSVKVLEGRGYNADGTVGFNAFGIVSFNPRTGAYTLHSHAMGYAGDFPLKVTADGYVWEVPAGPGAIIRYTAVVKDGLWRETGERIVEGKPGIPMFEMNLKRVSGTDWPAAGAISMK